MQVTSAGVAALYTTPRSGIPEFVTSNKISHGLVRTGDLRRWPVLLAAPGDLRRSFATVTCSALEAMHQLVLEQIPRDKNHMSNWHSIDHQSPFEVWPECFIEFLRFCVLTV